MAGMPRGRSLYGSIPEQLDDETSFVRQLQAILRRAPPLRHRHQPQVDIPDVSHRGMLVLVHELEEPGQLQLTVLNFAGEPIAGPSAPSTCRPAVGVRHVHRRADGHRRRPARASPSNSLPTTACRCWCACPMLIYRRREPRKRISPGYSPGLGNPATQSTSRAMR